MSGRARAALADCATAGEAFSIIRELFREAGVPDAGDDARLLACAALELTRLDLALRPHTRVDAARIERLALFAERRLRREPVTRILGARGFWSIELDVHTNVLDPRPDSEIVIEACIAALGARKNEPLRILDAGAGSGALLAALLTEFPQAQGLAIDISPDAVDAASSNLTKLGLSARAEVRRQTWADPLPVTFDLVVSNPPYVRTADIRTLDPEVRDHDPILALDGGPDGLDAYRALAALRPTWTGDDGLMVVEIGADQAAEVGAVFKEAGAKLLATHKDYAGRDRAMAWTGRVV